MNVIQRQAWRIGTLVILASSCSFFVACRPNQVAVAQSPEEIALNQKAEQLIRIAAEALNMGSIEITLEKCIEVSALMPDNARVQQRAAELLYLSGHPKDSIQRFDRANELNPKGEAHNWQRGIALATVGDFKRGAEQFKLHREVNPDDVENSAWYYLCVAKSEGLDAAKKSVIPSRGDRRQPMMNILNMLREEETPEQVMAAAEKVGPAEEQRKMAQFYADLYIALYHDSADRKEEAVKYLKRSLEYGINGYMADTARVYMEARFQKSKDSDPNSLP